MKKRVASAIQAGLSFIQSVQQPNGAFVSWSSPTVFPFKATRNYHTIFAPALILSALSVVSEPTAQLVKQKVATWLLTQKSPHWSFNYWARTASERQTLPYPDDLDDTFCSLIAFHRYDPQLIDAECLASVVKLLLAAEITVGGPYRTWLVAPTVDTVWQDVDLAVNSNIAYFLRLIEAPVPNLTNVMEQAIQKVTLASPYYPSAYPLIYYLTRAYDGPKKSLLVTHLLKRRQNKAHWGNVLHTALAITSLANLGRLQGCKDAIAYLLKEQQQDGSWQAAGFCLDPSRKGRKYYSGSAALTTAFVLEALVRYTQTPAPVAATPKPDQRTNKQYRAVIFQVRSELQTLGPAIRTPALARLEKIRASDTGPEIVLLPHLFNQSLKHPLTSNSALFEHLSLANMYGWMAYTIFDDFLDDEGDPLLLPVATISLRQSIAHFGRSLPNHQPFQQLVTQTFNVIDNANLWEVAHCRFRVVHNSLLIGALPRYGSGMRLAERSLGHGLTPLGILAAQGIALDDQRLVLLAKAFRHYLVARQLRDDIHDWERDLQKGHASFVVTRILQDLGIEHAKKSLRHLLPRMQHQFWQHTLTHICKIITSHTTASRKAIDQSHLITKDNTVRQFLDTIDTAVEQTISEQTKAKDFLKAYQSIRF